MNTADEVKESSEETKEKIVSAELSQEFEEYILEEDKTALTAILTEKTYEYCKEYFLHKKST